MRLPLTHCFAALELRCRDRVNATLEVESGLNDPMSVFLTVLLVQFLTSPHTFTTAHALLLVIEEMLGGGILGVVAGYGLLTLLRKLPLPTPMHPVLTLASVLVIFGGAQLIGASGCAIYLMGLFVGINRFDSHRALVYAAEAFAWLAQISLFLMLGLLVTPHQVLSTRVPSLAHYRSLNSHCPSNSNIQLPFALSLLHARDGFRLLGGFTRCGSYYLQSSGPDGSQRGSLLFAVTFGVVIVWFVLQGWTISPVVSNTRLSKAAGLELTVYIVQLLQPGAKREIAAASRHDDKIHRNQHRVVAPAICARLSRKQVCQQTPSVIAPGVIANAKRRGAIAAFHHPSDNDLLARFVGHFFEPRETPIGSTVMSCVLIP